ncbi:MAG TPA: tetratricopeptide repeat protein [Anaerolineales bacterium]|nr:tetratricopeptide repeat protein [Anaerolineales bacterium]
METSFGLWIKRRRKTLDLTQQELARQVGCSLATIVKIESDERRPSRQIAELLAGQLKIPPEQHEQFLQIARQDRAVKHLEDLQPAAPTSSPPTPHIPSPTGPLFGRDTELAEITRLLQDPRCRLLTLTGQGGIGKTQLMTHAILRLAKDRKQEIAFVSLAALLGREQIVTAIADALGIVLYTASDRAQQLASYLHDRETILALDNFEHLMTESSCLDLVGDLLRGTQRVKILITSRQPLQLQAEWIFEVQGLPVPKGMLPEELEGSSAVALFIQRASQVDAGFRPTGSDLPVIARICELVAGLPLGIELAAAWVRTLTCEEIAQEIQRSMDFLATSMRDLPERHRSIRATIEHSWKLLSAEEQRVLQRLAVFKGGFTREAAEYVAGTTLALLSSLSSKSLLHRMGSGRYDLHELVRQYSLEALMKEKADFTATQDRHSEYYALFLEQHGEGFKGADHPAVAAELVTEIANVRQAWRWAGERRQVLTLSRAADTLFWLYEFRCDCREGVPLFGYVAQCLAEGRDPALSDEMREITRARVMTMQGFVCLRQGQHPQSREVLQESLMILRPLAECGSTEARNALPYTLAFLGMVTAAMGEYADGSRFLNEALEIMRENRDRWGIAVSLRQLGILNHYQGAYEAAYTLLRESLEVSRAMGNDWATAYSLVFLGTASCTRGAYAEAQNFLQEGLGLSKKVGDRFTTAYALNGLGLVHTAVGDHDEAQQQLDESIVIWREIGDLASLAQSLNNMGSLLLAVEEPVRAHDYFQEALSVGRKAQLTPVLLEALIGEAEIRSARGDSRFALTVVRSVSQHPSSSHATRSRAERLCSELEAKLPAEDLPGSIQPAQIDILVDELLQATSLKEDPSPFHG